MTVCAIVRNAGAKAWPQGALLVGGLVHDLPALGPGAHATLAANGGRAPEDAARRTAVMRTQPDGAAALWKLELSGVADIPVDSQRLAARVGSDAMNEAPARRLAAMAGLALAAAVSLWWLGSTRLALDDGSDASRSAADALQVAWLVRGMALATIGIRIGTLRGWRPGAAEALGLIAPTWPLVALAWTASTASWAHVAVAELALLAAGLALPLIGQGLRRVLRRVEFADIMAMLLGAALAAALWLSRSLGYLPQA